MCSSPNDYSAIDFVWEMVEVNSCSVASGSQMYFWVFFFNENYKKKSLNNMFNIA